MTAALSLLCSGAVLDDLEEIPSPSAAELLSYIAERGDLIGRGRDGRAFLLLDLDAGTFAGLCAFGAEREDWEPEVDDDQQDESSTAEICPLDLPTRRRTRR